MQNTAAELDRTIYQHLPALKKISEEKLSAKPFAAKWSKKETMGHLIDSAQNNIRRFVAAQYEDNPFIVYQQDKWVSISNYQQWNTNDIIDLWFLLNKQICHILLHTPATIYERTSQSKETHNIEWLAADYVKHLLHHLHVVLELEPVNYP